MKVAGVTMNRVMGVLFFMLTAIHAHALSLEKEAELRNGALIFKNYCSGCHSLKYVRMDGVKSDLNISLFEGESGPFMTRLAEKDAIKWFGKVPPDLSLKAKEKGSDWLISFLTGFYSDSHRPFGVNNTVLPDVAMPQVINFKDEAMVQSLVAFLAYTAEPAKLKRVSLGIWVLSYLAVLLILVYCLKRGVWKS